MINIFNQNFNKTTFGKNPEQEQNQEQNQEQE